MTVPVGSYQVITIEKTPAANWDETIDWTKPFRQLGDDTISESSWAFDGPDELLVLADGSISEDGLFTTIWISAGTVGNYYTVTNTVLTSGGRTLTETFIVSVVPFVYLTYPHTI
jgi:hypothetical protein